MVAGTDTVRHYQDLGIIGLEYDDLLAQSPMGFVNPVTKDLQANRAHPASDVGMDVGQRLAGNALAQSTRTRMLPRPVIRGRILYSDTLRCQRHAGTQARRHAGTQARKHAHERDLQPFVFDGSPLSLSQSSCLLAAEEQALNGADMGMNKSYQLVERPDIGMCP